MPCISEQRHAELLRIEQAVGDILPHVDAWIGLLERHVANLPPDREPSPEDSGGSADRGYAEHELRAMRSALGALLPAAAPNS